jgi:hypothetical protein
MDQADYMVAQIPRWRKAAAEFLVSFDSRFEH